MRGAENSWPCCAAASAVSMDKNIVLKQAAGDEAWRRESSPRVARPVVESEIVESAYRAEGSPRALQGRLCARTGIRFVALSRGGEQQ